MDGGEAQESPYYAKLVTVAEGEWAGWHTYPGGDPFEDLTGPFYYRVDQDGQAVCAFRAEARHMNGGGFIHGGCVMTFADFSLFAIAREAIRGSRTVTATFNCELVGTARAGERVECRGEVVKAGRSMVFVRGLITAECRAVANFSSALKKTTIRDR